MVPRSALRRCSRRRSASRSERGVARAQSTLSGALPRTQTALVAAPTAPGTVTGRSEAVDRRHDRHALRRRTAGVRATRNLLAGTANGSFDMPPRRQRVRRGAARQLRPVTPPGGQWAVETAENIQGKIRYDRFLSDPACALSHRDGPARPFQGLNFRLNLDPGFKYLFLKESANALWAEAGYDFQYDDRGPTRSRITATSGPASAQRPVPVFGPHPDLTRTRRPRATSRRARRCMLPQDAGRPLGASLRRLSARVQRGRHARRPASSTCRASWRSTRVRPGHVRLAA